MAQRRGGYDACDQAVPVSPFQDHRGIDMPSGTSPAEW